MKEDSQPGEEFVLHLSGTVCKFIKMDNHRESKKKLTEKCEFIKMD